VLSTNGDTHWVAMTLTTRCRASRVRKFARKAWNLAAYPEVVQELRKALIAAQA